MHERSLRKRLATHHVSKEFEFFLSNSSKIILLTLATNRFRSTSHERHTGAQERKYTGIYFGLTGERNKGAIGKRGLVPMCFIRPAKPLTVPVVRGSLLHSRALPLPHRATKVIYRTKGSSYFTRMGVARISHRFSRVIHKVLKVGVKSMRGRVRT
jgi:hypothetical protein